ncbi:T9SS type A sorting domain-containing protein [Flavobacterium sp. J27]|uniref:T9SS type A sorting domain-containing protein n=1 Tax=Flavobacterium sp. J27 TaxID=2060419 RepID=UPI0010305383|nr:T9SS type A sorting domain-containing protein [Flavobacterium sp. J27]
MKKNVLLFFLSCTYALVAQNPQIQGDVMLCPWTNGTASVTNQTYDTYQWYFKYWFTSDPYTAIAGATSESFTYDWYTYDQALLKVVVTSGGNTYESNEIQIDSYAWTSLVIYNEMNSTVSVDGNNGNFLLCQGGSFNNTINSPYDTNIQWYKDDVAIPGANDISYVITEPGSYYVVAAPEFCPNSSSSNQGLPMIVEWDTNCSLSIENPTFSNLVTLYPNPVKETLFISVSDNSVIHDYTIVDNLGKILIQKTIGISNNTLSVNTNKLAVGFYTLILNGDSGKAIKKFIKE